MEKRNIRHESLTKVLTLNSQALASGYFTISFPAERVIALVCTKNGKLSIGILCLD
jgi:hypothetical protein